MDINEIASNGTVRRLGVGAVTAGTIALNKRFGLNLDPTDIVALVSMAIAYILQSGLKEAHIAGKEAAAKIVTLQDSVDSANKAVGP